MSSKVGVLAPGSLYSPRLPREVFFSSDIVRLSYPATAAGPLLILTGFPIIP